jgi:hypothetical protein
MRGVDPAFLPISLNAGGHIESDGVYLFLWYSGLSTKRYRLTTGAISDVGNPACVFYGSYGRAGTPLGDGGFVETEPAVNATFAYINYPQVVPFADGSMITSWYDEDTPDVDKAFKSIEFTFNSSFTATSVLVSYELDTPSFNFTSIPMQISQSGEQLVGFFPAGTIGKRIRYQITLNHIQDPDVQAWSTLMTLGRVWAFPVACRRTPQTRKGEDPQGLTAQQLLANLLNAYQITAGKVVMWVPDPTASIDNPSVDPITGDNVIGVSQVQAVLQDYQKSAAGGVAPGYRADESGVPDMESDVALTMAESLG